MTKLSKYQAEIVTALQEDGAYLWTNEGAGYQAWVGDKDGRVSNYIRRKSAESLYTKDVVVFSDGDYRQGLFRYALKNAE